MRKRLQIIMKIRSYKKKYHDAKANNNYILMLYYKLLILVYKLRDR